ncbi:MAG: hypothetical protein ABI054_14750 [Planctomycetota bacterium]
MDASLSKLISPFCGALRSKKYYFLKQPALVPADLLDASNDCWCARTQMRLGPDDDGVDPASCQAGRACYKAVGSETPVA